LSQGGATNPCFYILWFFSFAQHHRSFSFHSFAGCTHIIHELNKDMRTDSLQNTQLLSPSSSVSNSHTTQSVGMSIIKKRKLFQYSDGFSSSIDTTYSPVDEMNAYINDSIQSRFPLYWKHSQLSTLKSIVKRIFSIQASSAPVERVFSQAGLIMSPRRTSMLEDVFRSLVFLRVNKSMI
jgi:hypothetical protein